MIAATDYMRAVRRPDPRLRAGPVPGARAPTASAARTTARSLRRFFEVDRHYVAVAALTALADDGAIPATTVADAIAKYGIDPEKHRPPMARATAGLERVRGQP